MLICHTQLTVRIMIQIFVPVHRNVHWCLAVINMKDKTLQYLDSLGGLGRDVLRVLVNLPDQTESYIIVRHLDYNAWYAWVAFANYSFDMPLLLFLNFFIERYNWYSLQKKYKMTQHKIKGPASFILLDWSSTVTFFWLWQTRYIMDELKDKSNIEVDPSSWVEVSDSIPLQQNGYVSLLY